MWSGDEGCERGRRKHKGISSVAHILVVAFSSHFFDTRADDHAVNKLKLSTSSSLLQVALLRLRFVRLLDQSHFACVSIIKVRLPLCFLNASIVFSKMALKLLALGLLLVAAFMPAAGEAEGEFQASKSFVEEAQRKKDNSFDYFFFVQQWPGSFCDTAKGCCFPVTGEPGPFFGIHGLWPNRNDGSYPASCINEAFDSSELDDVIAHMNTDWGTLACTSSHNEDFWEHEWSKHGTCSGFTQHDYFQSSVNLYNNYDITAALSSAGIVPNDSFYPIAKITQAFTALLGFAPQIECNTDPEGNKQLYQVYICVAKDGKTLIQCPAPLRNPCKGNVQFPAFGSTTPSDDAKSDEL